MSTQEQPPAAYPAPQPKNGLGIAAFIVSLAGILLTCGVLSPIGLVLSLFALRKKPKGFAIAGAVISLVGTLWLVLAGIAFVSAFLGFAKAGASIAESAVTFSTLVQSRQAIAAEKASTGKLPDDAKAASIVGQYKDAWTRALRYQRMGDTFRVVSDGADAVPGTVDDVFLTETAEKPTIGIPR